jgi:hypothetical protein
MKDFAA